MGLADRAEHLPFLGAHRGVGILADLTERAVPAGAGFPDEIVRHLVLGLRTDVSRVCTLHVEAAARHDVHGGMCGDLLQELDIAADVGRAGIHDAANAFSCGDVELFTPEHDVLHRARPTRTPVRRPRVDSSPFEGQVLVEQRRGIPQCFWRNISQNSPDPGASGKRHLWG